MKSKYISRLIVFILTTCVCTVAYSNGLQNLQSGTLRGISQLQSFGLIISGGAFVVGGMYAKVNADRGKEIMIWAVLGCIAVVIGPQIPAIVQELFS